MSEKSDRPSPLKIRNLISRKVSECYQILRWDNDQYDELCGYRLSVADAKNGPDLWKAEWTARDFPPRAKYHYLTVWLSGFLDHSQFVVKLSANSYERHGEPRPIHLAGWYEVTTVADQRVLHDPHAPSLVIRLEGQQDSPGRNIFTPGTQFTLMHNCSIDELAGSNYSNVREWSGYSWRSVPGELIRKFRLGGQKLPFEAPSTVESLVLDMPPDVPGIYLAASEEEASILSDTASE